MKNVVGIVVLLIALVYGVHQVRLRMAENAVIDKHNVLVSETSECLDAGDWKCAERDLKLLLSETPDDKNLHLHLANVIFEQERYEDCVTYIDGLGYGSPDLDLLKKKANALIHEMATLGLERSLHFRVEFEGRPSRGDVLEALSVLEVAYDSLCRLFQFYPENKLNVVLHETAGYGGVGPRPDWVGAIFDGKLRIPVNVMQHREVYRPMLFHELTHAFVRAMVRRRIPTWVNEGIAQVVDASRNDMKRPEGAKPSISSLTEPFVNEGQRSGAVKLYWYSQKMVEVLLRRDPDFTHFRDFIRSFKELQAEESLLKFYGVTPQQLLDEV